MSILDDDWFDPWLFFLVAGLTALIIMAYVFWR